VAKREEKIIEDGPNGARRSACAPMRSAVRNHKVQRATDRRGKPRVLPEREHVAGTNEGRGARSRHQEASSDGRLQGDHTFAKARTEATAEVSSRADPNAAQTPHGRAREKR